MNWIYTIDIESDEPIMLINKHIGWDDKDGQGVDGSLFQEELLRLDTLGKKRIQVWISSEGGMVMDGYKIYNAILKSKTKVDTYNVGICASIAAVIFQAGRKRYMADYSLLMYHNPYGGESKELAKMRESIAVMIAERTNNPVEKVLKMMDRTTWISASESLLEGFCDEIEFTKENNVKHGNAKAMWETGKLVANNFQSNYQPNNHNQMKEVANRLGLNPEANESAILSEIGNIVNKNADMEAKVKKAEAELKAAQEKCDKMQEELDKMKAEMEEAEDKKAKAEAEVKQEKAKNMVEGYAKTGKIKIDSINRWVDLAVKDFEGTKNMLDELPSNAKAPVINVSASVSDAELTMVAAKAMQEVRNSLNIK